MEHDPLDPERDVILCNHVESGERPVGHVRAETDGRLILRCRDHMDFSADAARATVLERVLVRLPELEDLIAQLEPGDFAVPDGEDGEWVIYTP